MRFPTLFLALTLGLPAQAFTAENGLTVRPDADGFTVPWAGPGGASAFWCAAGDYAIRGLHLGPATVVYRASEPPRRSGDAIRFTLDPASAASKTGLLILGEKGAGITAGHAQSFCEQRPMRRN